MPFCVVVEDFACVVEEWDFCEVSVIIGKEMEWVNACEWWSLQSGWEGSSRVLYNGRRVEEKIELSYIIGSIFEFPNIGTIFHYFKSFWLLELGLAIMPYELRKKRERKQNSRHPVVDKSYYLPCVLLCSYIFCVVMWTILQLLKKLWRNSKPLKKSRKRRQKRIVL